MLLGTLENYRTDDRSKCSVSTQSARAPSLRPWHPLAIFSSPDLFELTSTELDPLRLGPPEGYHHDCPASSAELQSSGFQEVETAESDLHPRMYCSFVTLVSCSPPGDELGECVTRAESCWSCFRCEGLAFEYPRIEYGVARIAQR